MGWRSFGVVYATGGEGRLALPFHMAILPPVHIELTTPLPSFDAGPSDLGLRWQTEGYLGN